MQQGGSILVDAVKKLQEAQLRIGGPRPWRVLAGQPERKIASLPSVAGPGWPSRKKMAMSRPWRVLALRLSVPRPRRVLASAAQAKLKQLPCPWRVLTQNKKEKSKKSPITPSVAGPAANEKRKKDKGQSQQASDQKATHTKQLIMPGRLVELTRQIIQSKG